MFLKIMSLILPPALYEAMVKKNTRKKKPAKVSRIKKMASPAPSTKHASPPPPFGFFRLVLILISFGLAGLAQAQWIQISDYSTIFRGWFFLILSLVFLVGALWPWNRETVKTESLSPVWEYLWLVIIIAIAAFFRVYRLGEMPPGVYVDQGFAGLAGLKILHEGWRPFWVEEPMHCSAYLFYLIAAWFAVFKATKVTLFLFFVVISLLTLPLVYWTFRQLVGPRIALLSIFILAVMRWNVNFSRNGFPTIQIPFYMFGTSAFLLYGLHAKKRWPFIVASLFFGLGFYTYQAFKIFPVLLALWGLYLFYTNREKIQKNFKNLALFMAIFVALLSPFLWVSYQNKNLGLRETYLNIFSEIHESHSLEPVINMICRTAKMFNREGDWIERHNLPNFRMLDDITGPLFVLGFFFSLFHIRRKNNFFALTGFLVMCLPCLLSQDAAHANRMLGTTPFLALLAAIPVGTLWSRVRERWGKMGEIIFLVLLFEPLFLMGYQNFQVFFGPQLNNNGMWTTSVWAGYSVSETKVGEKVAKEGARNDCYLPGRFYGFSSTSFLGYDYKDKVRQTKWPRDLAPFQTSETGRGICYVLTKEQVGVLEDLKSLYPQGIEEKERDLEGNPIALYFTISEKNIRAARGLDGVINGAPGHYSDFPQGLPAGPYHAVFKGTVFVDGFGHFFGGAETRGKVSWKIGGHPVLSNHPLDLAEGFYSLEIHWDAPSGPPDLKLLLTNEQNKTQIFNSSCLTSLPLNHGLEGHWYGASVPTNHPSLVQWTPLLNFPVGEDFSYRSSELYIQWEGFLQVPETGDYGFKVITDEFGKVSVDGKPIFDLGPNQTGLARLKAGRHTFQVIFRKNLGPTFTLLWKTPKSYNFEPIPLADFGETH
jgi:4-amino-4-deoxy-L-arabinose transferase-like glycosyltransferase